MITSELRPRGAPALQPDAVVWVDEGHALVARSRNEGIETTEVRRFGQPEARYLARVVHEIGDHQHVMIVGPFPIRLAMEREYVAISHHPDRLIPVPAMAPGAGPEIIDRLEGLVA